MKNIETAVSFMEQIASDDSHGYDQAHRNGKPDYDCSSLVGTALNKAGFNVNPESTTRNLRSQLIKEGFQCLSVSSPRKRGDIFLSEGHHVVMCTDSNNIVHASINEKGTATGGKEGDQTGKEICKRTFYNHSSGWDYHFRYESEESSEIKASRPKYTVGKTYTLLSEMKVRTGAGTHYRAKSYKELTSDGKKHDKDKDGALDAGTRVSCLEVIPKGEDIWIRTPSGYIASYYQGKIYVK